MKNWLLTFCSFLAFLLLIAGSTHAQNAPVSFSRVAAPKFSYDAIIALPSPQTGELAFDTTHKCLRVYNGSRWVCTFQNPNDTSPTTSAFMTAGSIGDDRGYGVAVDATGNVYITGFFMLNVTFGSTTKTSLGSTDIFIAKYNSNGILQWVQTAGSSNTDFSNGIVLDLNGNVYITGCFTETISFGATSKVSQGSFDVFVAKYSNNGTFQWVQTGGGINTDFGRDLAVDSSGNVCITGYFSATATFGGVTKTAFGNNEFVDVFVAKYNTNGVFQWVQTAGGPSQDDGYGVAMDANGDVYITGEFIGPANFLGTNIASLSTNLYVAKFNSIGVFQWVRITANAYGRDIAIDAIGNLYVTGFINGSATFGGITKTSSGIFDIFIVKYNNSGIVQWVQTAGGIDEEYGQGIAVDASGNVYVTGFFNGTTTFDTISKTSFGDYDIFVAKYNTNGIFQWMQTVGGISEDRSQGIAIDVLGNVYETGYFSGLVNIGNTSKTSAGSFDALLTRFQQF